MSPHPRRCEERSDEAISSLKVVEIASQENPARNDVHWWWRPATDARLGNPTSHRRRCEERRDEAISSLAVVEIASQEDSARNDVDRWWCKNTKRSLNGS